MIKSGYLSINIIDNDYIENIPSQNIPIPKLSIPKINDKFIDNSMRQSIIEGFFNFYITNEVSEKDLKMLKWFYKNIGFTRGIKQSTLELLEDAEHYEDLAAVLLNNVYPELLDLYLMENNN